jgi:hypothetical protein
MTSRAILAILLATGVAAVGSTVHAQEQSLAEASEAAKKIHHEWPATNNVPVFDPANALPLTPELVAAPTAVAPPVVTPMTQKQIEADALIGPRLGALHAGLLIRDQTVASYRDACAGKTTSAGFFIRGVLVTTRNEDTPVCLAMAATLAQQTAAATDERAAIVENARTSAIPPGVVRALFTRYEIPD